jgi:hypothetical protein
MYQAGTSVRDVTPPLGYRLQGHAARKGLSDQAHDPLHVKALSLSDGSDRIAVLTSDLLFFRPPLADRIKHEAHRVLGLKPENFLLTAAHVHTGPFMAAQDPEDEVHLIPGYHESLVERILEVLRDAITSEEPVTLCWGRGSADIGVINRRLPTPYGIEMQPNPSGPTDPDVLALGARGRDGRLRAVLFNYACHPTTIRTDIARISADYPGAAQRELEARDVAATALFVNGCCGDVRPNLVTDGQFRGGSFEDVDRMGTALARATAAALDSAEPVPEGPVGGRIESVELPLDPARLPRSLDRLDQVAADYLRRTKRDEKESGAWYTPPDEAAIAAWKAEMTARLSRNEKPCPSLPMDVQVLTVGDVRLVGLGGEIMVEIGLRIKSAAGPRTLVCSCANGVVGNVPTAAALTEGGYETKSFLYRKHPAPYDRTAERILVERTLALVRGNRRGRPA